MPKKRGIRFISGLDPNSRSRGIVRILSRRRAGSNPCQEKIAIDNILRTASDLPVVPIGRRARR